MFGSRQYPEGQFQPQAGCEHNYHVWCATGALQVLKSEEYVRYLEEHPEEAYTVNFANGAFAHIAPGDPLWTAMSEIAEHFSIQVFLLVWKDGYRPWTGAEGDPTNFDAIKISRRSEERVAA